MRIKIKIKPGWDIEVLNEIRREYPDIMLTVDANSAYRLEKHLHILRKLDEYNLLYIEQPLQHHDLIGHMKLQREIETPICLDESIKDSHKAWEAIEIGATRVINIKPGRVGGITESKKIHDIAKENGIPVWIGGMLETGIGRAHNVSLATLENVKYPSDISASERYYEKDIITEPFKLEKDSKLSVKEGIGIGIEIDWNSFNKIILKEKRYR
jgi:O-succinylbenzoate synthase